MEEPRKPGRPPGKRFDKRFHFACSSDMYEALLTIADLAKEEATEVVRRMIDRELPFFLFYASANKTLPNGKESK